MTSRRTLLTTGGAAVVAGLALSGAAPASAHGAGQPAHRPVVIGHRGASGYRPEHTLASYELAIRLGADYVEPDLVSTKDGVLVARHENEISGTTDVAVRPEFAGRRATKTIDGVAVTGWFTEDFTLAELKTLRAKERLPLVRPTTTTFDGRFPIPTFQEVIDLARAESRKRGRTIGVYPETKHPTYFRSIGLPLEEPLVSVLRRNGYTGRRDPVIVQSFETGNLRQLARLTGVTLVQLLDASGAPYDLAAAGDPRTYRDLATAGGLREIARYAHGIGANKDLLVPRDGTGRLLAPSTVIRDAHRAGLVVHAWTFRAENQFLPADFRIGADPNARGDITSEFELFFDLGLDGVFSDHPDAAVAARAGRRA
ncbi:glycerophosphodiester phosphodiesterase [Rhizomonospora bruguierae]|uniref:glycerophosphodiester phosphodiesterase n=1 Tax=Rhizomonospora bruguierae TaxID=1581705 RepID=UPI001BD183EB|nr:glycerophosphodiester phosphodiesterase [Micromonospora sp. NBRC 107566]